MPEVGPPRNRVRVAALVVGLLIACGLGELGLRLLRPAAVSVLRYPCAYRPDPVTGYGYIPGASGVIAGHFEFDNPVTINSQGFYDEEPLPDGEASPRILALGDSFTAALNLPKPQVWTSVLEAGLRERGLPRADVVNLGIDGSGTGAHAALLEASLGKGSPDVVLLAFYANDVADVLGPQMARECYRGYVLAYPSEAFRDGLRAHVDLHLEKSLRRFVHAHSYLARLLTFAWLPTLNPYRIEFLQPSLSVIRERLPEPPEAGVRRWQRAMSSLESLARTCDCRLWVVPVPPRSDANGSLDIWSRRGSPELEVLDVLPGFEREREQTGSVHSDFYFTHDAHLNARGNALFGRVLADALAEELGAGS